MRVLSKFGGGRGFYVDDVEALQEQINQLRIAVTTRDTSFILGGCEVQGNTLKKGLVRISKSLVWTDELTINQFPAYLKRGDDISDGARFYDLDQGTFPAFFTPTVELVYSDPGGDRIRIDSSGGYTYEDYLAELFEIAQINATLATKASLSSVNALSSQKANQLLSRDWTDISLPSNSSKYDNSDVEVPTFTPATPQYSKDSFGFVHLRGHITFDDGGQTLTPAFTLPSGYRPGTDHVFITRRLDGSSDDTLFIGSDGSLKKRGIPSGSPFAFSIDHIHFYAG